ncbi:MAG: hypothetical protein JJU23_07310 [Cyclobacteriaceae bacterium]|nr:hypothetical protein [Cyclobacteriaceae bacterium]
MLIIPEVLIAQEKDKFDYGSEMTWGINKNTRGGLIGGATFKYSTAINARHYQTFGVEIMNITHPKEIRATSFLTGSRFVLGKSNYLYSIRPQYGREIVLFKKAAQQGIQVNAVFAAGPSLGLLAPYYINYAESGTRGGRRVVQDPEIHSGERILGTTGIIRGIFESDVNLGVNLKAGLSFEFGVFKKSVTGFEAGFTLEAFPNEMVIMPTVQNDAVFTAAYLTFFYGSRR